MRDAVRRWTNTQDELGTVAAAGILPGLQLTALHGACTPPLP